MSAESSSHYTVPGRDCGTCTVCCKDLAIVQPEFTKLPGILCEHCVPGQGCGIYETRFSICRQYDCGWRSLDNMDDSWRPDRSGVLITLEFSDQGLAGANLILVGGEAAALSDRFAGMVAGFVESGTETFLVMPADAGMMAFHIPLNGALGPAIHARDLGEVKAIIAEACAAMMAQEPVPISPELMQPAASATAS
ncbi:hypothetical protein KRR38_15805 [Novosphingobium sp. G106]|uniref:hypothetical protein n=1 Tax=Novosphingobium sp. G106 TaxID=2849500 RepID=UPI001C2CF61C|nr:hypothetical protein [Novosphingobium sp. G106]MBV1689098.1 hypothetical protein [Novosphingobium sp. G106]